MVTACQYAKGISPCAGLLVAEQGLFLAQPVPGCSVVLAGQSVSHDTDQLLPGKLASRGEIPGEVGSQDNDEDVSKELEEKEENRQG